MARYPREEISYKKLYNELDLDRPLNIEWPHTDEPTDIVGVHESVGSIAISSPQVPDITDLEFCQKNGIDPSIFIQQFAELEYRFDSLVCSALDRLAPLEPEGHCDICGAVDYTHQTGSPNSSMDGHSGSLMACNGCGIVVHCECYGIVEFSDKFWFCNRCIFSVWDAPCVLCNNPNGIFKRLDNGGWVHALCALMHPRLSFANLIYKDPVSASKLKKRPGRCSICSDFSEFLIRCSYYQCKTLYHTSCAGEHLFCDLNNRRIYCPAHDFTIGKTCSRRRVFELRAGYAELENEVFIRLSKPLQKQHYTEYREALEADTVGINSNIKKEIYEYWKMKRSVYKTVFKDLFKFSNYINGRND